MQTKAINVDINAYTPQQLVEDILVTGCLQAFNVTYNGDPISIGYFSGNVGLSGFDEGIVLTSGSALKAAGPDDQTSAGEMSSGGSDPDLSLLNTGYPTNDAAVLEFDFIPASDTIQFEYIFGSEEFPEFANSSFNDVFGFFLSGPGISGPYSNNSINIAELPNGDPVTIDNVFNNPAYYVGSPDGSGGEGLAYNNDIQYDGATIPLTAEAVVTACETYHIKLAIGDAGDSSYDSGVFFKAGSFTSGASFTATSFNPWYSTDDVYEGCTTFLIFTRVDATNLADEIPVPLVTGGTATPGVDYAAVPDTFYIASGQMADTLLIEVFMDGIIDGGETIEFTFADGCPCDQNTITISIDIFDELEWEPILENTGPICIGDTATVSMTLPPGVDLALADWQWTLNGSSGYSIQVNPTTTTTYTLEWTHPCQTLEFTSTVDVVMPPDVDLGDDFTVPGYTTPVNAGMETGNTGSWEVISGPAGGNGTFDDPNASATGFTVDELGGYEIVWTEISLAPNCVSSDTLQIEFYHVPSADFTISPSMCYGDILTVTFVGEAYDWAIFTWDFGDAVVISGSGQGPYQVAYPDAGMYDISLTVDELGYVVTETNSVLVPEVLEHDLSTYDDPCFNSCGGSAEVVVTGGTLPYTYSWDSGMSTIDDLCAGDYSLTVTDANGCTTAQNFVIDQPDEIIYDTIHVNVDCYGNATGSTQMNVIGGTPPYTYLWSNGASGSGLNNITAGIYTVTVTDAQDCWITETFDITQPDPLLISFENDMAICEGEVVTLTATPSGGTMPYTIYWSVGGPYVPGPDALVVSPPETTNFSVYVEDGHGCSSPVQDMDLTVSPLITLDLIVDDNRCFESCDGRAELVISGGIPPFDFSWDSENRIMEDVCSGLYDVTVTDQIGCNADTVFFVDQPTEIHFDTYTEEASCPGVVDGSAWVEVVGGVPPYEYIWDNGATSDNITVAAGIYSLTITDANDCRRETEVTVTAPEAMEILPGDVPTVCISGDATLSVQVMGGTAPYDYTWQSEDGMVGFDNEFTVSPLEDMNCYLTVTDHNGCMAFWDCTVPVRPPLVIHSVTINQDTVCANDPVRLYVDAEGGMGGPYTLTLDDGQVIPSPFTLYPQETQWWYVTLSDECETPSVTDSIFIPVWPIPEVNFVSDVVNGCPPLEVTFNELHENNNYTYTWSYGDNGFGFIQNPTHTYYESGIFSVSLTVRSENGCEDMMTIPNMVQVFPTPDVEFYTTPDQASILSPRIEFVALEQDADSLFWYFGDGDSAIWNTTNPVHFYPAIGEYGVTLVGENSYGCRDTAFKVVTIVDEPTFFAPTAFTPNGDGVNDCFRLCGNGIDPNEFYFAVFDRWGEMVFETTAYEGQDDCDECGIEAWDGTLFGNSAAGDDYLAPGLYTWYCIYLDDFGNENEFNGVVRLIR
jgi:gliding motility-associated-like protein